MLQIGVLGAGSHSRRSHGPALVRYQNEHPCAVELRAVCDLDRERRRRYATQFGFTETYGNVDQMLAEESLDAVIAVTPVATTCEIVSDLFASDVAVLIEKPPGRTVEETEKLRAVATRHDAPHAVSFNRRFNPAVARARSWIAANAAECPPTFVVSRLLRTDRFEDDFIAHTGIHAVDTVNSFLGRPERVSVQQWRTRPSESNSGDCCAARVAYDNATAQFAFNSDAGTRKEIYELFGQGYTIRIDTGETQITISMDGERVLDWCLPDNIPPFIRNGTLDETREFLDAVRYGSGFTPTVTEATHSVALATAMESGVDREFT